MTVALTKKRWLTREQKMIVLRVTEIIKTVCGIEHKDAFLLAKKSCVFHIPKRYAGGKTVTKGY